MDKLMYFKYIDTVIFLLIKHLMTGIEGNSSSKETLRFSETKLTSFLKEQL